MHLHNPPHLLTRFQQISHLWNKTTSNIHENITTFSEIHFRHVRNDVTRNISGVQPSIARRASSPFFRPSPTSTISRHPSLSGVTETFHCHCVVVSLSGFTWCKLGCPFRTPEKRIHSRYGPLSDSGVCMFFFCQLCFFFNMFYNLMVLVVV